MPKHRSKIEIMYTILKVLRESETEVKKTHLMYLVGLNYDVFSKYISRIEKLGLVRVNKEGYSLTDSGKRELEMIENYLTIERKLKG
ncbi:hypothetical protein ATY89_09170 [Sulfolobus acidocaldarius]|nr:winged helix-turn-helix domain-containing protein [Sulfolobus acidocaldarius]AGE73978.1 hypothetical protein SacRon12I_08735 [Sulfolobus acidocaldarius Ron12/I]WCM36062.1 hypothetical protein GO597_09790 [Sulfolobus acidocaldarius DSM 639]AGE71705.1 hypothetical protein SacN8_08725 [Sulfolobus acidocaldarius N8]ALU30639.1 hypothetical protein ATY89_09170 [Sulfolobus acidocaldarius]ALU32723.1 hypothetical protein ATZ20_00580 [Sulfolobus acidocaldarius]